VVLLVVYNHIDVVLRLEAVVHRAEHAIGIWWKIDANDLRRLVADDIQETRILMSKTIVVLSPDSRSQKDIKRCNLLSPGNLVALLEPLAMLVDHTVDDVDEWFVAVKQTMATGEDVSLEPT